jgi:hypothetical protein
LKRILSRGLISRITKLNLKLISSPSNLFEKFSHIEDRNLLANNPVLIITNKLGINILDPKLQRIYPYAL